MANVVGRVGVSESNKTAAVTDYINSHASVVSLMEATTPQASKGRVLGSLTAGVNASVAAMLKIAADGATPLPAPVEFTSATVQGYVEVLNVTAVRLQEAVTYPRNDTGLNATNTSFDLPTSVFSGNTSNFAAVSFVELDGDTLFHDTAAGGLTNGGAYQITSKVIMVELVNVDKSQTDALIDPACGTYQYKTEKFNETALNETYFSPKCIFWNETTKTWSNTGCHRASYDSNLGTVTCCCTHLTSFAAMVSGDEYSAADTAALELITLVGTIVSLIAIVLTVVSILSVKALRKQLRYKILLQMVSSLGLAQIFFAFVANDSIRADDELCQGWSMMTLYFLLAYFAWMNAESYDLYKTFIVVFADRVPDDRRLLSMSLFAWGMPLVIMLSTLSRESHLITVAYDSQGVAFNSLCWMDLGDQLMWAWYLPMAASLLVNLTISFMIIRMIKAQSTADHGLVGNVANTAKIAGSIASVTGIAWILAVFVALRLSVVFDYLFAIAFGLQACMVFYFHIFKNAEAKRFYADKYAAVSSLRSTGAVKSSVVRRSRQSSKNDWRSAQISSFAAKELESGSVSAADSGLDSTMSLGDDAGVLRSATPEALPGPVAVGDLAPERPPRGTEYTLATDNSTTVTDVDQATAMSEQAYKGNAARAASDWAVPSVGLWDHLRDVILQDGRGVQLGESSDTAEDTTPPDDAAGNAVRAWQQPKGKTKNIFALFEERKERDSPKFVRRNVKWVRNIATDIQLTLVGLHGGKISKQFEAAQLQDGILDMLRAARFNTEKDKITVLAQSGQSVKVEAASAVTIDGIMHDAVNNLLKVVIGEDEFKVSFLTGQNDKIFEPEQVTGDTADQDAPDSPLVTIHPSHEAPPTPEAGKATSPTVATVNTISDLMRSDSYHAAQVDKSPSDSTPQLDRSTSGTSLLHSNV